MSTENVDIVVTETGSVKAADALAAMGGRAEETAGHVDNLSKQTEHANSVMESFKGILEKVGIALGIKELIEYSDSYSVLISRLHQVTTSAENLVAVEKQLFELSENSRTSFEANANFYIKASTNAQALGVSQKQLLEVTELLNKSFIASGATEQQASQGLNSLLRGFTTGQIQGRQLITIMKDFPVAAKALADGLGVPVSALQGLAAKGQITAKSLTEAFIKSGDEINKAFSSVVPTVSSALGVLRDAFTRQIGILDQNSQGSSRLAQVLIVLAHNMDSLVRIVGTAVGAFLAFRAALLVQSGLAAFSGFLTTVQLGLDAYIARMAAAGVATTVFGRLTEALRISFAGLNATMAANPIAAVVTAAVLLAGAMQTLGPKIRFANDELDRQRSLLGFVLGAIRFVYHSIEDAITAWDRWRNSLGTFGDIFAALFGKYQKFSDYVAQATKDTDGNKIAVDNLAKSYGGDGSDGGGGLDPAIKATTKSLHLQSDALNVNTTAAQGASQVFTNLVRAQELANKQIKDAAENWKQYSAEVDANKAKVDAAALTTRNAMGDIVTATSDMALRAGDAYNRVAAAAKGAADAIDSVVSAQEAETRSAATAGGGSGGGGSSGGSSVQEWTPGNDLYGPYGVWTGGPGSPYFGHNLTPEELVKVQNVPGHFWNQMTLKPILGFRTGGAFEVGGSGGADTSLVQFMGTPGEQVEITTPAQRAGGKGSVGGRAVHVQMIVNTPDANSFRRSQPQLIKSLKSKLAAH